jgi:hypothetical protein
MERSTAALGIVTAFWAISAEYPSQCRPRRRARTDREGTVGRRRHSILDQIEGGIYRRVGRTPRDWFGWALGFAQGGISGLSSEDERSRCLELALFVCFPTGLGPRRAQTGVEMPSELEMEKTQNELRDLLDTIIRRQPIPVPGPERILRWNDARARYMVIVRDEWGHRAKAHFCELAAKFGHELRRCKVLGKCPKRWFLPTVNAQKFCSPKCETRFTTHRNRQRRRKRP